jgi:4-hydroxy-3-methylbut-2-enyl diphosphate reductase
MRVLKASALGFCFGVRDALAAALRAPAPAATTIHGELVHNETVQAMLAARGFRQNDERTRDVPATPAVLITAHGVSERERGRLRAAGKALIDTTCPLVAKVHAAAARFAAAGRFVVIIGKPGHVEVRGVSEDLPEHAVVAAAADVRDFGRPRIGIVCQTTVPIAAARELARRIRAANPGADVEFADTVCEPTKQRFAAVEELLPRVDAFVVVGGRNSNNTLQLVALCERAGVRVLHVQGAAELTPERLAGCATVGLAAGTSTLDATIEEVHARLVAMPGPA